MRLSLSTAAFLIFCFAIMAPLFAIPPLRIGYYAQVEFMVACIWLAGSLAALWNLKLLKTDLDLAHKIWSMPVVWFGGAIAGTSVLVAFIQQPAPLLSWTGNVQTAEGILTFLSLLFLSPVFVYLLKSPESKIKLFLIPLVVSVVISALTILCGPQTPVPSLKFNAWAPLFFEDFIAYYAIVIPVIYWMVRPHLSCVKLWDLGILVIVGVISFRADNQSLFLGFVAAALLYGGVKAPILKKISFEKKVALFLFLGLFSFTLAVSFYDFLEPYLPGKLQALSSVKSRAHLAQMTFFNFFYADFSFEKLLSLLIGRGWGEYSNAAVSTMTLLDFFSLFEGGKVKAYIDLLEFVHRDQVNSHNIFIEYFLSLGILGVSLFCYLFYKVIQNLRSGFENISIFYLATLGIVLCSWFQTPHTYVFNTFAMCILFSKETVKILSTRLTKHLPLLSLLSSVCLFSFSMIHTLSAYQYTKNVELRVGHDLFVTIDKTIETPWLYYDQLTGGVRTHKIARRLSSETVAYLRKYEKANPSECAEKVVALSRFLQERISRGSNKAAQILSLNLLGEVYTSSKAAFLFSPGSEYAKLWDETARRTQELLPHRPDVFVPYFSYLLTHGVTDKLYDMCQEFLRFNEDEPVPNWFIGVHYLGNDATYEKGLCHMRYAIERKIQKFAPIPQAQANQILRAAQGIQCYKIL